MGIFTTHSSSHRGCRSRGHGAYEDGKLELALSLEQMAFLPLPLNCHGDMSMPRGHGQEGVVTNEFGGHFPLTREHYLPSGFNREAYPQTSMHCWIDVTQLLLKFPCSIPHYSMVIYLTSLK